MLNIVVPDDKVDLVVKTIIKVNKTGSPGDGKIFVEPILDAIRVRTNETGDAAVAEQELVQTK
jgi:nitrogen regulatory protein PII 2